MIALVFAQILARWGQAVALFLLSLAATGAAAGAPAYAVAVTRAAIDHQVAAADPAELVASVPAFERTFTNDPDDEDLRVRAAARDQLAGLTPVTTIALQMRVGTELSATPIHPMVSRDGFCQRVTYLAGRCPVGSREAALPAVLAAETGLHPGEDVLLTPMVRVVGGWAPDGPPVSFVVVGVFEPVDPTDPYWVPMYPLGGQGLSPAIFTSQNALWSVAHQQELVSLAAVLPADLLTPARLPELRRELERVDQRLAAEGLASGGLGPGLPGLLDRIADHGEQARTLLPIAAAPLVALSWFVVYLAVGYGVSGRRHELGLVALRGARPWTRTVAVAAESLLPVLAGIPAGALLAPVLIAVLGPADGGPVPIDGAQLLAAGLAAIGTVAAVLLASRRELAAPVTELLRRVPPRQRRAAVLAGEVLAVVVAVVMVADLRALDGELVGVRVVAPAAVMLALLVLLSRLLRPLIDLVGRRSLRRGGLAPALAALYLARRPGVAPLLVMLGVVFGTVGFAAASVGVAAEGRVAEAQRALGAVRVLEVGETTRGDLLRAVRAADPTGRYALAAVSLPVRQDEPAALAVDATRLADVAVWPDRSDPAGAAGVSTLLRPEAPEPVLVTDGDLVAELSAAMSTPDQTVVVSLTLAPTDGGQPVVVELGPVGSARREYRTTVAGCPAGCRLAGVSLAAPPDQPGFLDRTGAVIHTLRQDGRDVGPAGWLADVGRWRQPERGLLTDHLQVAVVADGLSLWRFQPDEGTEYRALALDVPYPLPVVVTGALPQGDLLTGLDRQPIQIAPRATLAHLPGVGSPGVLMDLEYAERLSAEPGSAVSPRVWLAADAPAGIADRLRDQGLIITGDRTVDDLRATIDNSGAAMALRFHLLGGWMAVLIGCSALALLSAVDRRSWRRGLENLRRQGLPRRTTTATALWTYGGIVLAGAVAGALATVAAWSAAGARLPLGLDPAVLPSWPQWAELAPPWLVAMATLLAVALVVAWWQGVASGQREVGR